MSENFPRTRNYAQSGNFLIGQSTNFAHLTITTLHVTDESLQRFSLTRNNRWEIKNQSNETNKRLMLMSNLNLRTQWNERKENSITRNYIKVLSFLNQSNFDPRTKEKSSSAGNARRCCCAPAWEKSIILRAVINARESVSASLLMVFITAV